MKSPQKKEETLAHRLNARVESPIYLSIVGLEKVSATKNIISKFKIS